MSSGAEADAAALAALYNSLYTVNCCFVAVSVLFIYDSIVTFNREVTCFRTAKWTVATFLFLANKGISMILSVISLVSLATFPSDEMVPWAVFSGLRARALSGKYLGLLVFALSVAPIGVNLEPYISCMFLHNKPPGPTIDLIIYLRVLFILNTLHLILILLSVAIEGGSSYITIFTAPLTAILMSRFLLQLQEASQVTVRVDSDDPLHMSLNGSEDTPSFVRSLGGVIDPDLRHDDFDNNPEPDLQRHSELEEAREQVSRAVPSSSQA
ncbi:hypothetical protein L226DRAFT_614179 [Lentinus tigrinus ALCF2SS1-7]|uniref:uncharacterized protein n=1 Tax=Lentinus tigrinus ALCF2SS1-7 TaxID=1328758 RepID=UPI0011661A2B|nr:hypothetical protein L226DRAFT_614179 [Lentinus tigrinus ALCF2SS1-7]